MTKSEFKVGDRVRLTGRDWEPLDGVPARGTVVEITRIDNAGTPWFDAEGETWFIDASNGYEAELVTAADGKQDTARDHDTWKTWLEDDLKDGGYVEVHTVGPPAESFALVEEFADPISPNHYQFPGGIEVIDITRHMDFLTGNAVKYLTRAGRKGDRLEDLKKAAKYVQWAVEDAEAAE